MSLRDGMDANVQTALNSTTITSFWAAKLDFYSETVSVWTGPGTIIATGSGDPYLDGTTFDSMANGVVVKVGDNSYSYSGSDQFDIVLGVPPDLSTEISAANVLPAEWRARLATIWRVLMIKPPNALAQPTWVFRRIRTGSMDNVLWSSDGQSISFKLSIEGHAAMISQASGSTYNDQKTRYDPNDTSQDWAATLANGGNLQSGSVSTGGGGGLPNYDVRLV